MGFQKQTNFQVKLIFLKSGVLRGSRRRFKLLGWPTPIIYKVVVTAPAVARLLFILPVSPRLGPVSQSPRWTDGGATVGPAPARPAWPWPLWPWLLRPGPLWSWPPSDVRGAGSPVTAAPRRSEQRSGGDWTVSGRGVETPGSVVSGLAIGLKSRYSRKAPVD